MTVPAPNNSPSQSSGTEHVRLQQRALGRLDVVLLGTAFFPITIMAGDDVACAASRLLLVWFSIDLSTTHNFDLAFMQSVCSSVFVQD